MFQQNFDVSPKIQNMTKMTISFFPNKDKQNKKTLAIPIFLRVIGFRQKAEARISIEISPDEFEHWNEKLFRFE
jgi:hypothetical protein